MQISAIELRHLKYFVAIAELGSFRLASAHLHISQPPLTRQIQHLEEALGAKLFERIPKGVNLTAAGETLLMEAKNILSLVEQAAIRTHQASHGQLGRLDIGIFGSAIYGIIPSIIQEFRDHHPKVEITLHTMERSAQLKALRERRLTVGFNRFFDKESDLAWETVHSEHMYLAVYNQHPLAKQTQIKLRQTHSETMVLYPKNARPSFIDHLLSLLGKKNITPKFIHEVDDVTTAVALVSSRMGITIVPESACNLKLPNITYIPIHQNDMPTFDLDIIYRGSDNSVLLQEFLSTVRTFRKKLYPKH